MFRTQVEWAGQGVVTEEMKTVAAQEGLAAEQVRQRIAEGRVVIPLNRNRPGRVVGIGRGLRTKINASIGTSTDIADVEAEVRKAVAAEQAGADTLMELSVGGDLDAIRRRVLAAVEVPVGNVPLYQAFCEAAENYGDPFDRAMIQELLINCELAEEGRRMGCQMMVEGPGHVSLDEIEANIILQKRMSNGAPYYMLGPLPTDVGAAYDHVVAAIGAAQSARYGADLICYITPAEHLALPNEKDVVEGVKIARLAAHIGDLSKLPERTRPRDLAMSKARRDLDWEGQFRQALFPEDAAAIRRERMPSCDQAACTMCGEFCANRAASAIFAETLKSGAKA